MSRKKKTRTNRRDIAIVSVTADGTVLLRRAAMAAAAPVEKVVSAPVVVRREQIIVPALTEEAKPVRTMVKIGEYSSGMYCGHTGRGVRRLALLESPDDVCFGAWPEKGCSCWKDHRPVQTRRERQLKKFALPGIRFDMLERDFA